MYIPLSLPRKALLRQWSFLVMTDALVESVLAVEVSARFSTLPAPRKMNEKRRLFKEEQQRKKALFFTWHAVATSHVEFFPPCHGPMEAAIHAAENVHIGQLSAMFALVFFILTQLGSAKWSRLKLAEASWSWWKLGMIRKTERSRFKEQKLDTR